jgi:cytochrome d ubiquinol oxidase subunit I
MVGIGLLMILTGLIALVLYTRKRLFDTAWFQYWCMALTPSGFIAVLAGWFVTEIGRQPYIVYNVMRTAEAASPIGSQPVILSLTAFVITYVVIFGAGVYYIARLIAKGPEPSGEAYGDHGIRKPPIVAPGATNKGEQYV